MGNEEGEGGGDLGSLDKCESGSNNKCTNFEMVGLEKVQKYQGQTVGKLFLYCKSCKFLVNSYFFKYHEYKSAVTTSKREREKGRPA